jgi:hypothetical protein
MLEEGYDNPLIQEKLEALPVLNGRNSLAFEIYDCVENGLVSSITEAVSLLGLELTKYEMYSLLHKVRRIKRIIIEFQNKEAEKRARQLRSGI